MEYTPELIRKIQLSELEILKYIDKLCRDNGISYQADGGTILGAVRHRGFIPWDDDVDIRMLREDYDRFCEICDEKIDKSKYFLQTYKTDPGYRWGYARILKVGTFFNRKGQEMLTMKRGIFIDVFPCDVMPENKISKALFNYRCFFARKILYSPVGAQNEKNSFKRLAYKIMCNIPKEKAFRMFEHMVEQYKNHDSKLVRTLGWNGPEENLGFQRSWMKESCELDFEDMKVFVPVAYKDFCKFMFGDDYMIPPPKDKQVPKHTAIQVTFEDGTNYQ